MATSRKVLREEIKKRYIQILQETLSAAGEEILVTGSNEFAIPVVDREGNEDFVVIIAKIPTGSREDGEDYDGFAAARSYKLKCETKAAKAEEAARKKAAKIEKDKKLREEKAKMKKEE